MLMQMLAAGGMDVVTDEVRGADLNNPRGYFELERVKALETGDVAWVTDARGKAVKVIAYLLEYLPRDSRYRVVFIIRTLDEVLASQEKMLALRKETAEAGGAHGPPELAPPSDPGDPRMREIFYGHLAKARRLLANDRRFEVLFVRHEEVIRDPRTYATQIARFVGGKLDAPAMAGAVDPALHRTRLGG
jgi:hypothetical protein